MKKERVLLYVLAAIQFTHIMDFMIIMPLGDILMKLFGINPQQFSIIVSSYAFSAGISGFLSAFFIDRFDRKSALITAYVGFTIGTLACAFAPSYLALLLARILTGAFGGVLGALVLSIIGDAIPNNRRASAMGIVMAAFSLASVFGVPFGLYIAQELSWHAPFIFLALAGAIITGVIFWQVPSMRMHIERKSDRKSPLEIIKNVVQSKNQLYALLLMFLLVIGQFSVIPFITPYMIRNVGFVQEQIPLIYLIGGALTVFSNPFVGRLADRYGRNRIFTIFLFLSLIPLAIMPNLPPVPIYVALIVTGSFFVFISGRWVPASTMLTSVVLPQNRGSFMSISTSVRQLSSATASFMAGIIVIESSSDSPLERYDYVGYIAIAASLLAVLVSRKLKMVDE